MSATFKKNESVVLISSWDDAGTVQYRRAIVHSAGKVRMVLIDAESKQELGRHFSPCVANIEDCREGYSFNWKGTFRDMSDEEIEATCLEIGRRVVEIRINNANRRLAHADNDDNRKHLEKEMNAVHEPRCENHTGTPYYL